MIRKPGKTQKEKPAGCTGEGKILKGNIREGSREGNTGRKLLEIKLRGLFLLWRKLVQTANIV